MMLPNVSSLDLSLLEDVGLYFPHRPTKSEPSPRENSELWEFRCDVELSSQMVLQLLLMQGVATI